MNRINTSNIVDPSNLQPYTSGSVNFLQDVTKESTNAICRALIESKGYSYVNTIPYQIANAFDHFYIFFNGELYYLTDSIVGDETVAVLTVTPDAVADPLLFTDGFSRNVHENRILVATNTTLGTGLFDLVDIVNINKIQVQVPTLLNSWNIHSITPNYRVNKDGLVVLAGMASHSATGSNNPIFNLPIGARPSFTVNVGVVTQLVGSYPTNQLVIDTTGDVYLGNAATSSVTVFLDGICFYK